MSYARRSKIKVHYLTQDYLQAMILHDQLEKRRLERSASENGADIRRPMISGLHHTSITPPGWVETSLATMIQWVNQPISVCFPWTNSSPRLFPISILWIIIPRTHTHTHTPACVHVHYRGLAMLFLYSHLESTHLSNPQSQPQIPSAQSVHPPLQTATANPAALMNGDDKRPFNHIQTYR